MGYIVCIVIVMIVIIVLLIKPGEDDEYYTFKNSDNILGIPLTIRSAKSNNYEWHYEERKVKWDPKHTALIIVDLWEHHKCKKENSRIKEMSTDMNKVISNLRNKGVLIIHAPAGVHPDNWVKKLPNKRFPKNLKRGDPSFPLIIKGSGCNSPLSNLPKNTNQSSLIKIDKNKDVLINSINWLEGWWLSGRSQKLWNIIKNRDIHNLIYAGDATNMCIMNRPYGVQVTVKWGLNVVVIRELTHAMFNPISDPPYVSHKESTKLMLEFIEKFWAGNYINE